MIHRLDRIGEAALIYEGAVLALRRVGFRRSWLPTISECVWAAPPIGIPIVGYLGLHFWRRRACS